MSHVFISYSKKNKDYALKLVTKLRDEGFDVWIDDRQLRSSEDWWSSIVRAIWSCAAFIVILSPESDGSRWVQREVTLADGRGKPMFPLLLKGDLNTPNWALLVRTQYEDVTDGKLPGEDFFSDLAVAAPRKDERGKNLNETGNTPKVEVDEGFAKAVENPPEVEETEDVRLRDRLPLSGMLATVLILILIVALAITAARGNGDAPEITATVENTAIDTSVGASLEMLNAWRVENDYAALTADDTLNAIAERQLSYLSSLTVDQLPNVIWVQDQDGLNAANIAEQAGYDGAVQMFVEITDNELTLADVLLKMDVDGLTVDGADIQTWAENIGLSQDRSPDTNKIYFVMILGG